MRINQSRNGDFVRGHVMECMTYDMEFFTHLQENNYDRYVFEHEHYNPVEWEKLKEEFEESYDDDWDDKEDEEKIYQWQEKETLIEYADDHPEGVEVLEWWEVSETLYDLLNEFGEYTIYAEKPNGSDIYIWGRTTSGQAIKMDWIIQRVCDKYYGVVA